MLKIAMVYAVFFAMFQSQAQAANYTAVGILTTHNAQLNYFKTEFVKIEGFKDKEACEQAVKFESHSTDYIGTGGTNKHVPGVQWNFDANCMHVNDEY